MSLAIADASQQNSVSEPMMETLGDDHRRGSAGHTGQRTTIFVDDGAGGTFGAFGRDPLPESIRDLGPPGRTPDPDHPRALQGWCSLVPDDQWCSELDREATTQVVFRPITPPAEHGKRIGWNDRIVSTGQTLNHQIFDRCHKAFRLLANAYGFANYHFVLKLPNGAWLTVSDLGKRALESYEKADRDNTNPLSVHSKTEMEPFDWEMLADEAPGFWRTFACPGQVRGRTIPYHGPRGACCAVSFIGSPTKAPPNEIDLADVAYVLLRGFIRDVTAVLLEEIEAHPVLTPTQREVIELLSTGLTMQQIAEQLEVHVRSVEGRVARAIDALGASTRLQAIIVACELGYISRTH